MCMMCVHVYDVCVYDVCVCVCVGGWEVIKVELS